MAKITKESMAIFVVLSLVLLIGCNTNQKTKVKEEKSNSAQSNKTEKTTESNENGFSVSSNSYEDNAKIPVKNAYTDVTGGQNLSPQLGWSNLPEGTKSVAISMVDKSADNFLHWLVINLDPKDSPLEEGASGKNMPSFATEFKNDFGKDGYGGPAPPAGAGEHEYEITVYALNIASMGMSDNASLKEFESFTKGKILDKATLTGKFSR